MRSRLVLVVFLVCLVLPACVGRHWQRARNEDTVAAYHRFLRDHGDSRYGALARERLAFARVRNKPSAEAFERFREQFPDSELVSELRPVVEESFFAVARSRGSAAAYREFLEAFPDGVHAARARGNAVYLEERGYGGRVEDLRAFAAQYPESDFAAEAERSAVAVDVRSQTAFRRIGLLVQVAPSTPGADRLARVFAERAVATYEAAGLELVPLRGPEDPRAGSLPARIVVSHSEEAVRTRLEDGQVSEPGILARTEVVLERHHPSQSIFREEFEFRASMSERRDDVSILFGAGTESYWSAFFLPVARWSTGVAVRKPQAFAQPVVAVEVAGPRAIALHPDGSFQIFDLADPVRPVLLGEYRRPRDLSHFGGLATSADRIVIYGEDGIEVVHLGGSGAVRERVIDRGSVGSISGLEFVEGGMLAAGNRGLLWLGPDGGAPRTLVAGEVFDLARVGDRMLFVDGTSLRIATLPGLLQGRLEGELRLGTGFRPTGVRSEGRTAIVFGDGGLVRVDLSRPSQPRALSRLASDEIGAIEDAVLLAGRLFALGRRGLQVAAPSGERILESADVVARRRLAAAGRHLVLIGESSLQVVDATPFVRAPAAASPR